MDKFLEMLLEPSTMRGLIIAIGSLAGFAVSEEKIAAVLVISGLVLGAHEIFRKQYDTEKLNKEG